MKILLAKIMYKKNISVRQLADMTGIPKTTIHNIMVEKYSPTMDNLERIAQALQVRISNLYDSPYKWFEKKCPAYGTIASHPLLLPSKYRIINITTFKLLRTNVCENILLFRRKGSIFKTNRCSRKQERRAYIWERQKKNIKAK